MLSVNEAATLAGVSVALVYGWVAAGILPHYRLGLPGRRGAIRIAGADLDAFLASQRTEGRKDPPPPPAPAPRQQFKQLTIR
jgi:excisionase family DNA binding protein